VFEVLILISVGSFFYLVANLHKVFEISKFGAVKRRG